MIQGKQHRPALDHLPLATYQAWYATLPARPGRSGGPLGPTAKHRCRAEAARPRNRFSPSRACLRCDWCYSARARLRTATRALAITPPRPLPPPTPPALYLWMRQVGRQPAGVMWASTQPGMAAGQGLRDVVQRTAFRNWRWGRCPSLPLHRQRSGERFPGQTRAQAVIPNHLTPPLAGPGCMDRSNGLRKPCSTNTGRPPQLGCGPGWKPCAKAPAKQLDRHGLTGQAPARTAIA